MPWFADCMACGGGGSIEFQSDGRAGGTGVQRLLCRMLRKRELKNISRDLRVSRAAVEGLWRDGADGDIGDKGESGKNRGTSAGSNGGGCGTVGGGNAGRGTRNALAARPGSLEEE
jgi:hypothetical protein